MEQGTRDYIVAKTKEMIAVDYCCEEAKAAGEAFLKAAGTAEEDAQMKAYVAELKEDLLSIEELIAKMRTRYGIIIDGTNEERFVNTDVQTHLAFKENKEAFKNKLRQIGFYNDLSDAYILQKIRPRY